MPTEPLNPTQARRRRRQIESEGHDGPIAGTPASAAPPQLEVELPPDAIVTERGRDRGRRNRNVVPYGEQRELGTLVQTTERDVLDSLVLHDEARADIQSGIRTVLRRADFEAVWQISRIQPQAGRSILNFYGPPGTGKTRAALAVARAVGKPLYQVDYSAIISPYVGMTARHIKECFDRARDLETVLFFDEADSLLSRRLPMGSDCATSINQNRNTLMQCLDEFDGIVVMTTNLFGNYDPALLRRIARHVRFDLPDKAMRKRLFELHLPAVEASRVQCDLDFIAQESRGLAGGDILNVCLNAIYAGSESENASTWKITNAEILSEIEAVKIAKENHLAGQPQGRE